MAIYKIRRLWTTVLGGGSLILGVGIIGSKLYNSKRDIFDINCLCESHSNESNNVNNLAEKPQEVQYITAPVAQSSE